MRYSRGFVLLQELALVALCCLLLAAVSACLLQGYQLNRRQAQLLRCREAALKVLAGETTAQAGLEVERTQTQLAELELVEVIVTDGKLTYNLLQVLPPEK